MVSEEELKQVTERIEDDLDMKRELTLKQFKKKLDKKTMVPSKLKQKVLESVKTDRLRRESKLKQEAAIKLSEKGKTVDGEYTVSVGNRKTKSGKREVLYIRDEFGKLVTWVFR